MLVEFTIENFRSYRESRKFSLVASASKELPENLIASSDSESSLLRTAALYGPNASGKSNLFAGLYCIGELLLSPLARPRWSFPLVIPFTLAKTSISKPTRFSVKFICDGELYEYTIALRPDYVEEERFVAFPLGRPQEWFHRTRDHFKFNETHLKGQKKRLQEMTGQESLFLGVAAAFAHPQLSVPAQWLMRNLRDQFEPWDTRLTAPRRRTSSEEVTARSCRDNPNFLAWVTAFLRHADLGIQSLEIDVIEEKIRRPVSRFAKGSQELVKSIEEVSEQHHEPVFIHSGEEGFLGRFRLQDESHGTRRLFALLSPLFDVLENGGVAIMDELSASMHPSLVRELVRMFHNPNINKKNSQLLFTTHDTALLSGKLFRRDQVWFAEKSPEGATDLYSLHDFKDVREGDSFEKGYMRGRYGAIPFFPEFDFPPSIGETNEGKSQE